jgi:hypothetical protein
MLVRVAVADLLDRLCVSQQSLCRVVHCSLHTRGLVRSEHLQGNVFGCLEDLGEIERFADLWDGVDGKGNRWGKRDAIIQGDGCGEKSIRYLCVG